MIPYGTGPAGGCCPQCGCSLGPSQGFAGQPAVAGTFAPAAGAPNPMAPWSAPNPWNWWWSSPTSLGWGLGGGRRWGGTYSPQFTMSGLPTDSEIVEMVYDAIDADPLIPYNAAIDVESEAGTVTLTGTVVSKQIKHATGDDAWYIPGVSDVRNEIEVSRGRREEHAAAPRQTRAARA